MNIKQCKEEIKHAIQAYLSKDEFGQYKIPVKNQRPILLIGPPGIGKTAIMEQIARECGIAMVGYTITHHTRQSAVGLPKIEKRIYQDVEYDVTEYTMSEIITSVYEKIKETGLEEGILFIDEINCVSETLAPTMLQFLQNKTFGNQAVPKGWVIVSAGNPPEYNKSVREFDIVTLDRVRQMEVTTDYSVWKEYAYKNRIHPVILSYLDVRTDNFYRIETTVDGKRFITARGWEDLSLMIRTYEELQIPVTYDIIYGYIRHEKAARDFANYLELYYKYKTDYSVEDILHGRYDEAMLEKLRTASFDEKLSILGLLLGRLGSNFTKVYDIKLYIDQLYEQLLAVKEAFMNVVLSPDLLLEDICNAFEASIAAKAKAGLIDKDTKQSASRVSDTLEAMRDRIKQQNLCVHEDAFAMIKEVFAKETQVRQSLIDTCSAELVEAFLFMERCFGESQEMVVFVTELTANYYSMHFIREHGCDAYYKYNKSLLFSETRKELLDEIQEMKAL